MKKWKVWSFTLVALMLLLSGCSGSAVSSKKTTSSSKDETIKIGMILSATGTFAPLTEGIKNGFNLYLEEHNNMLGGKNVEVKFEDDEANPQVALRKYRQLVTGEKVNLLVGPI